MLRYTKLIFLICFFYSCSNIDNKKIPTKDILKKTKVQDTEAVNKLLQRKDSILFTTDSFEVYTREANNQKKVIYAGNGDSINNQLWIRYKITRKEEMLVDCRDDEEPENIIVDICGAELSYDRKKIYFICNACATTGAIHEINLNTKKERFVCFSNYMKVIRKGRYKGNLIVQIHKHTTGNPDYSHPYNYYYIINDRGKELVVLGEEIPLIYK